MRMLIRKRAVLTVLMGLALIGEAQVKKTVALVLSDDPAFQPLAQSHFAPAYMKLSPAMRTSTVIFQNNTDKAVAGYVFKWIMTQNGLSLPAFMGCDQLMLIGGKNPNAQGLGVRPHTARIISPAFNLHESNMDSFGTGANLDDALKNHPSARSINAGAVFTPSLDLIVYDDGTFEGPDEAKFSQRMTSDHNARHDAGVEILLAQKRGETTSQIEDRLQADIKTASVTMGSTENDLYLQARARYASQFLTIYKRLGEHALTSNARTFASAEQIQLRRAP